MTAGLCGEPIQVKHLTCCSLHPGRILIFRHIHPFPLMQPQHRFHPHTTVCVQILGGLMLLRSLFLLRQQPLQSPEQSSRSCGIFAGRLWYQ